jgi:hypothetical protein
MRLGRAGALFFHRPRPSPLGAAGLALRSLALRSLALLLCFWTHISSRRSLLVLAPRTGWHIALSDLGPLALDSALLLLLV